MRGHSLTGLMKHDNSAADIMILYSMYIYALMIHSTCMYSDTYSKSIDQPGKVAFPARGQLNRGNGHFTVRVRA